MALMFAGLTLCTGCMSFGTRIYYRTGPQDVYNGLRGDFYEMGHGNGWMVLDLPFSFVCDTLLLPYDLTGPLRHDNPLQNWKEVGGWRASHRDPLAQTTRDIVLTWKSDRRYRPDQSITDDVMDYIKTEKLPPNINPSFWENGTGHHAARIVITDRGKQTDHILFYDEQNVRIKRQKLKYGRPSSVHM